MTTNTWIWALVVLASGLLFGEIAGRIIRSAMSRPRRSPAVQEMARPVGTFVFWAGTAVGLFAAVATASPNTIHDVPERSLDVLPDLLIAAVFLIAGYAVSIAVAAAVGQSALRATGVRHRSLERLLRASVLLASVVLALSQIGVDTAILVVILIALLGAPGLAMALLSGFGGREVAANIAAGRALRSQLRVGALLVCRGVDGRVIRGEIVEIHPVTVELLSEDMATLHLPLKALLEGPFEVQAVHARPRS